MHAYGRIDARPAAVGSSAPIGLFPLPLGAARESYLYVPNAYQPEEPMPLVLLLHGSGGHASHGLDLLLDLADREGLILLAPASTDYTWDIIVEHYGPDVMLVEAALRHVFDRYSIDPDYIAIGGFSDGASYALSLGLTNGRLFRHVLAFSPGFSAHAEPEGQPRLFVSHGTQDTVLPIDQCSRRLVPRLEEAGYAVEYVEFDGGHTIPQDVAQAAVRWLLDDA